MTSFDPMAFAKSLPPPGAVNAFDPDGFAASLPPPGGAAKWKKPTEMDDATLVSALMREQRAGFDPKSRTMFPMLTVNSDEGIDGWAQTKQKFKGSMVGELNFLRSVYGERNVEPILSKPRQIKDARGVYQTDPDYKPQIENFAVRIAPDKVTLANPKGADRGDLAGAVAGTVEAIPSIAGGIAGAASPLPGGAAAGAGGGAVLGNLLVQGIGAMLPGDENLTAGDRATTAGVAGLIGAATEGVGPTSRAIGRTIVGVPRATVVGSPGRAAGKMLNEVVRVGEDGAATMTGREAAIAKRQLGKETKVDFTLPQLTGGSEALHSQGKLMQSPVTGQILMSNEAKQAGQAERFLRDVIDRQLGPGGERVGSMTAAENVGDAYTALERRLYAKANADFGAAMDKATLLAGGQQTLPASNFSAALDEIYKAHKRRVMSSADAAVAEKVGEWRQIMGESGSLTPHEMQNMLKDFGKKAKTGDGLIKDVERDEQAAIGKKLKDALMADLNSAADSGAGGTAEAAQIIRGARDGYKTAMNDAETVSSAVLDDIKKKIGAGSHDEFATLFLSKKRSPNQIEDAIKILNRADPTGATTAQMVDSVMERLIEMSPAKRSNLTSAGVAIDPGSMASNARTLDKQIRALYTGNPQGYASFRKGVEAMRVISDYAGMNVHGSQTYIAQAADGFAGPTLGDINIAEPQKLIVDWLKGMGARQHARLITDPKRVDILLGIEKATRSNTRTAYDAITKGIAQIQAIDERKQRLFGDAPDGETEQQPQPQDQAVAGEAYPQ